MIQTVRRAVKTYRYKLEPTPSQHKALSQWLGACRYVYNLSLSYKKTLWEHSKISIGKNELQKELAPIAKETPWIGLVHSQTLQEVTDRVFMPTRASLSRARAFLS